MVTGHVRDVPAGNLMMPEMTIVNAVIPKTTIIINKGLETKQSQVNQVFMIDHCYPYAGKTANCKPAGVDCNMTLS
jgi:hypothetical protein